MDTGRREFIKGIGLGAAGLALGLGKSAVAEERKMDTLRWGVIGVGKRSWQHLKVITQLPNEEILALCEIQPDRLKTGLGYCKGKPDTYTDFTKLLERKDLDAILVATPNYCHKQEVVAALGKGLPVLTEKPMGITVAECNEMIDAAKSSGKILQVGLQLRYAPVYQKTTQLLRDGAIGKLKFVWFNEFRGDWAKQSTNPEEDNKINWRFYNKLSGGTLLEKSCHYFDLFNWFIGTKPEQVIATGGINFYTNGRDTLDHASVAVTYEDGCKATHGLSMYSPHGTGFFLIGEKGALEPKLKEGMVLLHRNGKEDEIIRGDSGRVDQGGHVGTYEMHESFSECVRTGKAPLTDPSVGKESIRVGLAGELAIKENRLVKMSEIPA